METLECNLSVITINYNGYADTCELIASLPQDDPSLEVIVVDNGSANNEAARLAERFPYIIVIPTGKNLGFAGGNNVGIRAAKGRYFLFINNDTFVPKSEENPFLPLLQRMEASPETGVVCPKLRFSWGQRLIQFAGYTPLSAITVRNVALGCGEEDHGQYDDAHPTPYAHGAAMLVRREAIEKAGMMPECYFLYYEELDWSMMFRRAGYDIWYEPRCTVFHKESQATGQNSPLKTYYLTRNRLLLVRRNWQGIDKWLASLYLLFVVAPKDIALHLLHRRFAHAKAVFEGACHFILKKYSQRPLT